MKLKEAVRQTYAQAAQRTARVVISNCAYNLPDARAFLTGRALNVDAIAAPVENRFMSAFIRAVKTGSTAASPARRRPREKPASEGRATGRR